MVLLAAFYDPPFFVAVKKLVSLASMATCPRVYLCFKCGGQMSADYLCRGCGLPIHWFCSAGDHEEIKEKGHGAHYWCTTCHAKMVVQAEAARQQSLCFRGTITSEPIVVAQEPGSVLKNSSTN